MGFKVEPVTLAGEHVRLEPLSLAHVEGLFAIGQQREDWAYLPVPGLCAAADARQWVEQALQLAERGAQCPFVLVHPASGRPMGSTRFMNIRERDRGLEIGYSWLGRDYQRTAVNTEAKYLLLSHAFDALDALRVELKTDLRNLRSQRAIERLGARREGVFRRHMLAQDGHVRDSVYYSITDLDWPGVRAGLQSRLQHTTPATPPT